MTLHRLTDEGSALLNTQLQQLAEAQQDVDFGGDLMDFDPIGPASEQPQAFLVLTPPKISLRKRSLPVIKPDARIELSDEVWKKQRMDLSYMVVKRPPLPVFDSFGVTLSNDAILPVCLLMTCEA